ncbi:MAG: type II toxin-antitoxin system RelE/ParE family toxin [Clostridia bacterium]|nr:type II toxin-antitoxin system RelE/ParE family toxin [Clostridia bacterium]
MWKVNFTPDAKSDLKKLDKTFTEQVLKGIAKVRKNPLPRPEGYGKPLGNKHGNNLTGFFKIKYRGIGIRVVYTLVREERVMNILVVSKRDDEYCYDIAIKLYQKYGDDIFNDIFPQ